MDILLWLQEIRTPFIEDAALVISLLCDKILIMLVFCWIFWCRDKKWAYGLALSFAISGIAVQGLKLVCRVDRPFVRDGRINPVPAALETATGFSFPSGHTQVAASLLGFTAFSVKRIWVKLVSFAIILLVMLSRMILGVHTPVDVIASFVITILTAFAVNLAMKREKQTVCVPGICVSLAFFIYSVYLVMSGTVDYSLAHDGIVTSLIGVTFFVCRLLETRFINFDTDTTFSGKMSVFHQLVKFIAGFSGVIVIYFGLSVFDNVFIDGVKYVGIFTWICALYPLVIKKFGKRN